MWFFSTICDFEEEIGEALNTMKALLLYRPGEACGLLESIFQPIVQCTSMWFFPLGCYIRQSRVHLLSLDRLATSLAVIDHVLPARAIGISRF